MRSKHFYHNERFDKELSGVPENVKGNHPMTFDLDLITQEALALPSSARAVLAERLLQSLDENELSDVEDAWILEAERRRQELKSGKVSGIAADEVFAEIRKQLQ